MNQLPQQGFRQIGRDVQALRCLTGAQDDFALTPEIARGTAGGAFDRRDLLAERLAAGDQPQQLLVEFGQGGSQLIERHRKHPF